MAPTASAFSALTARIEEIAQELGGEGLAVSLYDYETGLQWSQRGDRWFHSASTIKVAVLLALFGAIDAGRFTLDSRLHVRNRFLSLVDGTPFRVAAGRDADKDVHASIGKASFEADKLVDNIHTFLGSIMRAKPQTAKGKYVRGITLSSTMGPGVTIADAAMTSQEKHV